MDIELLKPHPRNYKTHPEDQVKHIAESLRQHGFYRNVIVARDNTILGGHGVIIAAKSLGWTKAPVMRVDLAPDDPLAMKILAGDNELGRFAESDDRLLSEILREINNGAGLLGTGYDEAMLANLAMVTRHANEIQNFDAAAEWVGMPDYDPGGKMFKLIITFENEEDRKRYVKETKLTITVTKGEVTWSTHWPYNGEEDVVSLRFDVPTKKDKKK